MDKKQLNELIDQKINEIFFEYQKANGIFNGDVSPHDVMILKQIKISLADLITDVCKGETK